jgi:integrase/recombinase XerD
VQGKKNYRRKGGLSPYTINSYARGLKAYFSHLEKIGHIEKSPAKSLRLPKLPKTSKNAISDDDLNKMLNYAMRSLRDYAIILVLRDSGCRVGELVTMRVDSLHFEKISIQGKNIFVLPEDATEFEYRGKATIYAEKTNEYRQIFFQHEACTAVLRLLETRLPNSPPELWLSERNEEPLQRSGVYQRLKKIGAKVGAKTFNPHAFRHRLAKKMKERRVDPEIISRFLGHKDVSTYLSIYGTTKDSELQDYHTIFSAVD